MSPAPARTSADAIVAAARALLEERGLDGVTMATVAARVGVRPPSLYKHVRDRPALLTAVIEDAAAELGATLDRAAVTEAADPRAHLEAIADGYRAFARRSPRAAALLFVDLGPDVGPPRDQLALAARPVIDATVPLVGEAAALAAARAMTAFVHGFTAMESAGAFRLGGDVDEAWRMGIVALVGGLAAARPT